MEEIKFLAYLTSIFHNNPALLVAMFGWIVTLIIWQRSERYHRNQYKEIGARHDQERQQFIEAIRDMKQTMCSMRDLMIKMDARL